MIPILIMMFGAFGSAIYQSVWPLVIGIVVALAYLAIHVTYLTSIVIKYKDVLDD